MINQIDEGIIVVDATDENMPIIFANKGFCNITGYEQNEVIGCNPNLLTGPDTDTKTSLLVEDCIKKGKQGSFTAINYKKNGIPYWNQFNITPVYNSENNITHWIGISRDVTLFVETTKNKSKDESMIATINTISDLLNNFLNYISYFKQTCSDIPNFDNNLLSEFDDAYEKFISNIRILYSAVKFKNKNLGNNFSVLDLDN